MSLRLAGLSAILLLSPSHCLCLWAQAPTEQTTAAANREEPIYLELGGFANFVNNNYGKWTGGNGKIMFRTPRFSPIFGYAYQRRPEGHQSTFGMDAYIAGNRWFYMIGGVGGAPEGTASLYPDLHYGITGLISLPWPKGLVATLGASQIHGEDESYARVLSSGAMYYLGRSIWSGSISFNRSYPGAVPSKSGNLNVQYGTQDKFWIGAGVGGGRIAYQTVGLEPLNVRFQTYGPSFFYQQWVNTHWGFIVKYDYQNQIDAFQRHGLAANLFFELP